MGNTHSRTTSADALVIFGVTGDLAQKMIFPALYAMAKSGVLNVPVLGVAASKWSLAQLRKQATISIKQSGKIDDRDALDYLLSLLQYVGGGLQRPGYVQSAQTGAGRCPAPGALKPPPQRLFDDSVSVNGRANYLRFRLSPNSAVALAARVKRAGKEFVGDQRELYLLDERLGEETPYERLLSDAMAGDGALFTREDAVEAAWAVVDPVLDMPRTIYPYKPGSWGPKQAGALIAVDGSWHNPIPVKEAK